MAMVAAAQQRYLGGDLSMLPSYEDAGTVYRDSAGKQVKPLRFLKRQGWNAVRVRLFVDPQFASKEHQERVSVRTWTMSSVCRGR